MDSGASHNLMPKIFMEELGLEVTKAYHDLYSFDSRKGAKFARAAPKARNAHVSLRMRPSWF
jgi:hypothetical protein